MTELCGFTENLLCSALTSHLESVRISEADKKQEMEAQLGLCQTPEIRTTTGWIRWIHVALRGLTLNKVQLEDRCVCSGFSLSVCLPPSLSETSTSQTETLPYSGVFVSLLDGFPGGPALFMFQFGN